MSYETVLVEKKDNYAIVTFNRPTKFNAANAQLFADLTAAINSLDADKEVGCIILTGQEFIHPKKGTPFHVFSAGADVEQFSRIGEVEAGYDFIKVCFEPFKAIENSETPVIAAVNGAAFGFGFDEDFAARTLSTKPCCACLSHFASMKTNFRHGNRIDSWLAKPSY